MIALALLIVQTASPVSPAPEPAFSAVARPCAAGPGEDGDVVVCARSRDSDRLKPIPALTDTPDQQVDPLLVHLPGGSTARLHAVQRELSGATSQGAAVTFTVPLGRRH